MKNACKPKNNMSLSSKQDDKLKHIIRISYKETTQLTIDGTFDGIIDELMDINGNFNWSANSFPLWVLIKIPFVISGYSIEFIWFKILWKHVQSLSHSLKVEWKLEWKLEHGKNYVLNWAKNMFHNDLHIHGWYKSRRFN